MECPICKKEMTHYNTLWICKENEVTEYPQLHTIVVLCDCGRRMIPEAEYKNNKMSFWKCPHCFNRS